MWLILTGRYSLKEYLRRYEVIINSEDEKIEINYPDDPYRSHQIRFNQIIKLVVLRQLNFKGYRLSIVDASDNQRALDELMIVPIGDLKGLSMVHPFEVLELIALAVDDWPSPRKGPML